MPHINEENSICLWHIPRTAGTFLRDELNRHGLPMDMLVEQHAEVRQVPNYHSFRHHAVIIRDQEDWLASIWKWLRCRPGTKVLQEWFGGMTDAERGCYELFAMKHQHDYGAIIGRYYAPRFRVLRTESVWQDATKWLAKIRVKLSA